MLKSRNFVDFCNNYLFIIFAKNYISNIKLIQHKFLKKTCNNIVYFYILKNQQLF